MADLMPQGDPAKDTTPEWLNWLKKPENLMTGIVLLAGLTQDRRPGQSKLDQLGQVGVGSLAFRGGLQSGIHQQQVEEQQRQQQTQVQNRQLGQGDTRNQIAREGVAAQSADAAAQRTSAEKLATTPRPLTPEEAALTKAQTGYYDRMPRDPVGTQDPNARFKDPIEELIATKFIESKMMQNPNWIANPMEVLQHLQPYRNARTQVDSMRTKGLMGEIVQSSDGQYKVRVTGVADAQPTPGTPSPEAPISITPSAAPSIEGAATEATARRQAETNAAAQAAERNRPASLQESAQFKASLDALEVSDLDKLLRKKDLPVEQARVVRTELNARMKAQRGRGGVPGQPLFHTK